MGYLSSLRTGAATGIAAKYLAPKGPKTLGVIGPGWQATFQVEAVAHACPSIERIIVFGRTPKRRKDFIREMSKIIEAEWHEVAAADQVEAELFEHLATDGELQVALRAELFKLERDLFPVDVMFMYKVIEWIGDLADQAQRVGSRLHRVLAR
jgi:uncharacterized protein Yka (UPF0111/DUF47 family)